MLAVLKAGHWPLISSKTAHFVREIITATGKQGLILYYKNHHLQNLWKAITMENQAITALNSKQKRSWTNSEKASLTKALAVIIKGQNAYGKSYNLQDTIDYLKYKLEKHFTVNQVVFALDKYTDDHDDIPTPSAIKKILSPTKLVITQTEYIAAKEWQKTNNRYDEFTDAYDVIKSFHNQEHEKREDHKIEYAMIESFV